VGTGGGAEASTATFTDCPALPPRPLQINVNVLFAVSGPVLSLPIVTFVPDQLSNASQVVAFVDDHVSVVVSFTNTEVLLADKVTVGAGGGAVPATSTVVDWLAVPARPVQDKIKTLVVISGRTLSLPASGFSPDQAPKAWQEVAFSTSHSSVDESLLWTDDGLAISDMTGA